MFDVQGLRRFQGSWLKVEQGIKVLLLGVQRLVWVKSDRGGSAFRVECLESRVQDGSWGEKQRVQTLPPQSAVVEGSGFAANSGMKVQTRAGFTLFQGVGIQSGA